MLMLALIASFVLFVLSLILLRDPDLASFAPLTFMLAVLFLGLEWAAINATNKIKKNLSDMGYSQADAEALIGGIIGVLKEETKPNPSPEFSQLFPNLLKSYVGWTRFTQRQFISALETTLYLRGKNKL